ncbi:MAG: YchJ family metal-binding protein [Gammaproteobacteria bacterium]|jgi:SEC-C motif-containing protein|nr:YchJ family metal-binding protein [Gammaproteobacteria bacterium]
MEQEFQLMIENLKPCPCTSGKLYNKCCGPFLERRETPRTVKQLMRSRYTAFALGNHGDYLLGTWHPSQSGSLTAESLSVKATQWLGLKILDYNQQGNAGMVEFEATYSDEEGNAGVHHEKSQFIREGGKWLYLRGKT